MGIWVLFSVYNILFNKEIESFEFINSVVMIFLWIIMHQSIERMRWWIKLNFKNMKYVAHLIRVEGEIRRTTMCQTKCVLRRETCPPLPLRRRKLCSERYAFTYTFAAHNSIPIIYMSMNAGLCVCYFFFFFFFW